MVDGDSLNLFVIQSYDPFCSEIIDKSSSAHVYTFQNETNSWVKSKIGGVFFLYKRIVFDLGGLGLRVASASGNKDSRKSPTDASNAQGINQLMNIIRGSGETATGTAAVLASRHATSKTNRITTPTNSNRRVPDTTPKQPLSNQQHPNGSPAPNLLDLLHKAEVDFNTESLHDCSITPERSVNSELQRLKSACNIRPPVHQKPTKHQDKITGANKAKQTPVDASKHISVAELEQQMLHEHQTIPGYLAADDATDESSNEDPMLLLGPRPAASTAPTLTAVSGGTAPGAHATDRVNSSVPTRLLSDLDTGYVDDIEDEDDSNRSAEQSIPLQHRSSTGLTLTTTCTTVSTAGLAHRKPRKFNRHTRELESPVPLPKGETSRPLVPPTNLRDIAPTTSNLLECGDEDDDDDAEILVTPAMLTSINPPCPSPLLSPHATLSTGMARSEVSTLRSEDGGGGGGGAGRGSSSSRVNMDGLTRNQLREALVFMLQTDDEFLHHIHAAYLMSLQHRLQTQP